MDEQEMLELGKPYGLTAVCFGGCVLGSPIHPGEPAAMRQSAHAHNRPDDERHGWVCFKAYTPERISPGLFWHEVGHIWRRSWTEGQCSKWGRQQVKKGGTNA